MVKGYEVVIGLETHAELNTESKIYCDCKNQFGLEVNSQVCPICMGMPGTLPTLNEKVVDYAIRMGHALNCEINRVCKQDRKNYFYPDRQRLIRYHRQKFLSAARVMLISLLTARKEE